MDDHLLPPNDFSGLKLKSDLRLPEFRYPARLVVGAKIAEGRLWDVYAGDLDVIDGEPDGARPDSGPSLEVKIDIKMCPPSRALVPTFVVPPPVAVTVSPKHRQTSSMKSKPATRLRLRPTKALSEPDIPPGIMDDTPETTRPQPSSNLRPENHPPSPAHSSSTADSSPKSVSVSSRTPPPSVPSSASSADFPFSTRRSVVVKVFRPHNEDSETVDERLEAVRNEQTIYEHGLKALWGRVVPQYYGTWTPTQLQEPSRRRGRHDPLVLMLLENIPCIGIPVLDDDDRAVDGGFGRASTATW